MAGLGYKDFTAGAVLTAAQVNTYLMEQSVMNFAGTAARGSALSSVQAAGMVAHVGGGTLTVYNGSAWNEFYPNTGAGLAYVAGTAFSAVSSVSVNNCFSATYQNYRVLVNTTNTTASVAITLRLRVSGSDASGSNYYGFLNYTSPDGTQNYLYSNGATSFSVVRSYINGGTDGVFSLDILRPFDTDPTNFLGNGRGVSAAGNEEFGAGGGIHTLNTSYDGFSLLVASGTVTGNVRVYGYRNS